MTPPKAKSGALPPGGCIRYALAAAVALGLALASAPAMSQIAGPQFSLIDGNLQKRANGVVALMQYTLFPDVTTSSLSISSGTTGNPAFRMTQAGGGFTWSRSFQLYLEGNVAYSIYDPTFTGTNGIEQVQVSAKWTSVTATGGIGWDFPLASELKLRPVANFTIGHMDSQIVGTVGNIGGLTGQEINFLKNGSFTAVGYGGALMLDYERYRREYEIDVEVRYTLMYLQSIPETSEAVRGEALAQNLNLWSRWRAPIGLTALHRPVRYVLEFAYSYYFGNQDDVLGFNHLLSLGGGLELDTSAYPIYISRIRLMARYRYGEYVSGYSFGLGISF